MRLFFCFFLFLYASAQPITSLTPGVPVQRHVNQSAYDYYSISTLNHNEILTITVTTLSGDPDLFADLNNTYPRSPSMWMSRAFGDDSITLHPDQYHQYGANILYVSVYGYWACDYTVVASFESVIHLTEGVPQAGSVSRSSTDYFELDIQNPDSHGDVTFTATPISGSVMMYIATTNPFPTYGNPATYNWSTPYDYNGQPLVISRNDTKWPANGVFYIAIYGGTAAQYSLVAAGNSTNTILRDDIPIQDHCNQFQSAFYQITVTSESCSLRVTVTPFYGDPDLYVDTNIRHPGPGQAQYQSTDAMGMVDEIWINPAPPTTYYIGIYGFLNTTFTLLADISCTNYTGYIVLINGIPQIGNLNAGDERFYSLTVLDAPTDIIFSLTRNFGNPDLYVTACPHNEPDCPEPVPGNSMYNASSFGEDSLTISDTCHNCTYLVGVYGQTNTSYSLVAVMADHIQVLQAGVPIYQTLRQGQYQYFRLDVDSMEEVTITVQPLGYGDPDLYVSTGNHYPNNTSWDWTARRGGTDSISIPYTDSKACQHCSYYISVYGFTTTTFTLVATFNNVIRLQNGVPQSGFVALEAFAYYQIQVLADHQDITLTISSSGDVNLYVNAGINATFPELNNWQWYVPYYSAVKQLIIHDTDPGACTQQGCWYRIGVFGQTNATFTLLAVVSGADAQCIPLVSGVAQREHLDAHQYQYFCISVLGTPLDLSIVVTTISGDPDLYVSRTNPKPNATDYEWRSIRAGSDTIDIENATVTTYYIGVYGFTNTTFNLLGLITNETDPRSSVVQLFNGQPQEGAVHHGTYSYYRFTLNTPVPTLTISLTVEYGDPDLYVMIDAHNGVYPTRTTFTWSSTSIQNDAVRIDNPSLADYLIGVYAYSTSGFSIVASAGSGLISLQNGIGRRDQLNYHQYMYYVLPVDSTDEDFTVSVTPFSGDPDLYVSLYPVIHPSTTNYTWKATSNRGDSITVGHSDPKFCRCDYYISVYAFTACSYSIVAFYAAIQNLQNGVPVNGVVRVNAWVYYRLRISEDVSEITFTLTPQDGDPDLYISTSGEPNKTSSMWKATGQQTTSTIVISSNDVHFCSNNCSYYVGIYGVSGSNYTLRAVTNGMTTQLMNGVPQSDTLQQGHWDYFSFDVPTAGVDVSIIITAITGDPDLYVSSLTDRPNQTNFQYAGFAFGGDAIAIENSPNTTWYIGVYAYLNTTFTIAAYMNDGSNRTMMLLVNGVPQTGVVNSGHYRYYDFYVTQQVAQLTFTLARTVGNPDLYVRNDGQLPSKDFFQWSSAAFGNDIIYITPGQPGEYQIAIYGGSTSNYTIKAETDAVMTTLIDGISFTQFLQQGTYKYFRFPVDRLDEDLTFTVTGLNGDPDLFVSDTDANPKPNATHYTWRSTSFREDAVSIPKENLHIGNYYASVLAYTNCTFTVLASLARTPTLQDGIPQSGFVPYAASNYYVYNVLSGHTDITFTLTPVSSGNAYIYISKYSAPDRANSSTYQWSGMYPTGGQQVIIRSNDPNWCDNCIFHIQVWGHEPTNYTLIVSSSVIIEELQEGIPRSAWVDTAQYKYFKFTLTYSTADMQIVVTAFSGDPDLYVSTRTQQPSTTNYQWKSTAWGYDAIDIDYTDPNYIQGVYYIAVYAFRNSSFSLLVSVTDLSNINSTDRTQILVNGVPQVGFLPETGDAAYYEFAMGSNPLDVTFTVTPRYGDPDLYIRNDGLTPTNSSYQWSSRNYGRDAITIYAADGCINCRYIILAYAYTHTLYSIVATTSQSVQRMESGIPVFVSLQQGGWSYYSIYVDHTTDPLIISATALSGDPDVYVSINNTHPNTTSYDQKAIRFGSDQIVYPTPQLTTYYIACYAFTNTSFTLLATIGPILLVNGEPHQDTLDRGQARVFVAHVNNPENKDLFVTLNVDLGSPVLYVGTFDNGTYPSAQHYQWTTADTSGDNQRYALTIPMGINGACNNCSYFITVSCPTNSNANSLCSYAITMDYADSIILLSNGKPYSASVNAGSSKYFRALIDDSTKDINVATTTFDGDVEIFVSTSNPYPNQHSYDWSSGTQSRTGDHVAISHSDPKFRLGTYYIGIFGILESRFSLTLATGLNLLTAGIPQYAALTSAGTGNFFWNINNLPTNITLSVLAVNATGCNSPSTGNYTVYISNNDENTQPGPDNYVWKFKITEGESHLILTSDKSYCTECTYYMAIEGAANKTFTIQVSTQDTPDTLLSSRCASGLVDQGTWKYYQVFVSQAVNFVVLVESCTGNADVYASQQDYEPNLQHYKWKSTETIANDYIEVADNSINNSDFYIGVYGRLGTTYQITTWTSEAPPQGPETASAIFLIEPDWNSVKITFAPAYNADHSTDNITYTAYYALQDSPAVMYSLCGLSLAVPVTKGFTPGAPLSPWTVTIHGLQSNQFYKFNLVARDANGNSLIYLQATGIHTLSKTNQGGVDVAVVVGVGLPLALLAIAVIAYLIYRNRQLSTNPVEFEMPEIPKRWKGAFTKLMEPSKEDDEDAESDPTGGHSVS